MSKPNVRHLLKILLRHLPEPLLFEVREAEATRLELALDNLALRANCVDTFIWFDTVDGKSVLINTAQIQVVHILWEPTPLPMDSTRHEGRIDIYLCGRPEKLSTWCASPDQLFTFYVELENYSDSPPFLGFEDEDGERLLIRVDEIVMVQAPLDYIRKGEKMANQQDG